MTGVENVTEPHSLRPNTLRVRRHRQRRREGLRLLAVEIPEPVIEAAIARGLLKPEDCTQSSSVMRSAFAAQLSDTALNWLTSNAVITWEQRTYGLRACVVAGRSQRATFLPMARIRQAALGKTDRQS